jgi:uncharacterized tellurite resistance protein B-like protein
MGFFEKLKNTVESGEIKRKKSHLKNLFQIAMADGKLANEEFDFLLSIANKLYLDSSIHQNVIHFPEDINFYVPQHDKEKLDQIYDCVCMALIDGEVNDKEISMCKLIAAKLGFRPIIVDRIIENILSDVLKGITSEIAVKRMLNDI